MDPGGLQKGWYNSDLPSARSLKILEKGSFLQPNFLLKPGETQAKQWPVIDFIMGVGGLPLKYVEAADKVTEIKFRFGIIMAKVGDGNGWVESEWLRAPELKEHKAALREWLAQGGQVEGSVKSDVEAGK